MFENFFAPKLASGYGSCAIRQTLSTMGWGAYRFTFADGISPSLIEALPAKSRGGIIVFPEQAEYLMIRVVSDWMTTTSERWYSEHRNNHELEWTDAYAVGQFFRGRYQRFDPATDSYLEFTPRTCCVEVAGVPLNRVLELASLLAAAGDQGGAIVLCRADNRVHLVARSE